MAFKCSSGGKSCTSLGLNQKLETIKLSEEDVWKAEIRLKAKLLSSCQRVRQVLNAEGKFWKEMTSATPVNT